MGHGYFGPERRDTLKLRIPVSPLRFPWEAGKFGESEGKMPGNFCPDVPLFAHFAE
jgi:hypothetical protein